MTTERFRCPCCGYWTLSERGFYQICPVCFWEDDEANEQFGVDAPERPEGPNRVHLWEARINYQKFGAAEQKDLEWVRPPKPDEIRD